MHTIGCRDAVEQLLAYIENPDLDRAGAQAAIRHLSACPDCERRVAHFYRAWATDEEDGLTCQECQDLLPDYVQAEREGQSDAQRWRPLALHLAMCPHCSVEHTALSDLMELAWGRPPYPSTWAMAISSDEATMPVPT